MDKSKVAGRVKKAIDVILILLYIVLLGYSFTGAPLHEVTGILFMVIVVIHNIINIKWYKTSRKGIYNRRRKITTVVNYALVADMVAILLTGIVNSRYLFRTGLHIAGIGRIHMFLAAAGFALIVFHVLVHAFGHAPKKHKVSPVALVILISILAVLLDVWLLPYLKRHFLTVEIHQETVVSGERVDLGGRMAERPR